MEISVVVPTYNRCRIVLRTLETLFAQSVAPSRLELIVVVDGSTDDTLVELKKLHPTCGFQIIEQQNRGLAGARNSGYKAARSELILFLDDDMLCDRELVAAHLDAHKGMRDIAGFGAILLSTDSPPSLAAQCFNREIGSSHIRRKSDPSIPWAIRECVFSNTSILHSTLDSLGGFDETFRMREDLEFGIRLLQTTTRPIPVPCAIAYQYYNKTATDLIRDSRAFAEADYLLAQKHPTISIEGHLSAVKVENDWKDFARNLAARKPELSDFILQPLCHLGERFYQIPAFQNLGIRALQARRRIHWLHRIKELQTNA
jgi:glycosyltransferase involved in cell wall biosynthesis